jgi:hypothetical protein
MMSNQGSGRKSPKIFPGGNQSSRFSKKITEALKSAEGQEICKKFGLKHSDIGTHSIRKYAGTYACSGSTAGPSMVSISVRMGWTLGNVADRYLKFERAGVPFLGRVLSGLAIDSIDFITLPPHFNASEGIPSVLKDVFLV